jgi:hypothetical protein
MARNVLFPLCFHSEERERRTKRKVWSAKHFRAIGKRTITLSYHVRTCPARSQSEVMVQQINSDTTHSESLRRERERERERDREREREREREEKYSWRALESAGRDTHVHTHKLARTLVIPDPTCHNIYVICWRHVRVGLFERQRGNARTALSCNSGITRQCTSLRCTNRNHCSHGFLAHIRGENRMRAFLNDQRSLVGLREYRANAFPAVHRHYMKKTNKQYSTAPPPPGSRISIAEAGTRVAQVTDMHRVTHTIGGLREHKVQQSNEFYNDMSNKDVSDAVQHEEDRR